MVDCRYVFSLRRVENARSAVQVLTGLVCARQTSLVISGNRTVETEVEGDLDAFDAVRVVSAALPTM
jgi:hypothetical protein